MVENPAGDRQKVKSIIELKTGDYCLTQQNIAIDKISKKEVKELLKILNGGKDE